MSKHLTTPTTTGGDRSAPAELDIHRPDGLTAVCALLSVGVLMLLTVLPRDALACLPPCPWHALTSWYCPGCGSLRACHAMLHMDWKAAWQFNPLAVVLAPMLTWAVFAAWLRRRWHVGILQARARARTVWLFLAVLLVFTILRNLPVAPFDALAP